MKSLRTILNEEGECMATPGNTMGMGNPFATADDDASEPLTPIGKPATKQQPRRKRKKKLLEYVDEQLLSNMELKDEENPFYTKKRSKVRQGKKVEIDQNKITVE